MRPFKETAAKAIDATASALHSVGATVYGQTGSEAADALANTFLAPIRSRVDTSCDCDTYGCPNH